MAYLSMIARSATMQHSQQSTPSAEAEAQNSPGTEGQRGGKDDRRPVSVKGFRLDAYYEDRQINPSHRALMDEAALARHVAERSRLFTDKLGLPSLFFKGLDIAEVGADTGENALVFARWGAKVSAFEPREQARCEIPACFDRFGLGSSLRMVGAERLETVELGPFDFVNAEGFVASIDPMSGWLEAMDRLVAPEGLFHVSYFARRGAFVETMIRGLVAGFAARRGITPLEAARTLMMAKWDGVGSARVFETWVMDHITNPVARLSRAVDPSRLIREAAHHGFRIQSSTPSYRDPLWLGWYKADRPLAEELPRIDNHLARAALGQAVGAPIYYGGHIGGAQEIAAMVDAAMGAADDCVDCPDKAHLQAVAASLRALHVLSRGCNMWVGRLDDTGASPLLTGLAKAFTLLSEDDFDGLTKYCAHDPAFIQCWGTPVHFAVFRRDGSLAGRGA